MKLCSSGHNEVRFEGRKCPACEALDDLTGAQKEMADNTKEADTEIGQLEAAIARMEIALAEATA